jgi:hypothetical protein
MVEEASGGAPVGHPHGVTEFRAMDQAGAQRRIALGVPAKLTQHGPGLVHVDTLPDQWGTVTPLTSFATRSTLVHPASEEGKFQIRDVVVVNGGAHRGKVFRRRSGRSFYPKF